MPHFVLLIWRGFCLIQKRKHRKDGAVKEKFMGGYSLFIFFEYMPEILFDILLFHTYYKNKLKT